MSKIIESFFTSEDNEEFDLVGDEKEKFNNMLVSVLDSGEIKNKDQKFFFENLRKSFFSNNNKHYIKPNCSMGSTYSKTLLDSRNDYVSKKVEEVVYNSPFPYKELEFLLYLYGVNKDYSIINDINYKEILLLISENSSATKIDNVVIILEIVNKIILLNQFLLEDSKKELVFYNSIVEIVKNLLSFIEIGKLNYDQNVIDKLNFFLGKMYSNNANLRFEELTKPYTKKQVNRIYDIVIEENDKGFMMKEKVDYLGDNLQKHDGKSINKGNFLIAGLKRLEKLKDINKISDDEFYEEMGKIKLGFLTFYSNFKDFEFLVNDFLNTGGDNDFIHIKVETITLIVKYFNYELSDELMNKILNRLFEKDFGGLENTYFLNKNRYIVAKIISEKLIISKPEILSFLGNKLFKNLKF